MILALDIGTTALKGALLQLDGTPLAIGQRALDLVSDKDSAVHYETDAMGWVSAIRSLCQELGVSSATRPEAVVVSGNGPTLIPVGQDDRPLHRAMLWMDRRCTEEAKTISELNGFYVDPTFYLPKALWFFRTQPRIYEETKYFFGCPEYISYLLTGNPVTYLPADGYAAYIWSEEQVLQLDMDWAKFPRFVRPGDALGATMAAATERFGIPEGVPVFAGGPDFIVSIIGTGTVAPGRACDRAGTSEGINLCTDQTISDRRLLCVDHVIDGYRNISGMVSTSGKALQWFKDMTGQADASFSALFEDIAAVPPGSNKLIFLPYLTGERAPIWDPNARGTFIGMTMHHRRREMTRAVVESIGYAIRDILSVMEEIGLRVDDVRITGGQAKSATWTQIKADITGKRFLVPVMKDAELAGDLCLALVGLGAYDSLAEAAEVAVLIERVFEPNLRHKKTYDDLFDIYRASYAGLRTTFARLGELE